MMDVMNEDIMEFQNNERPPSEQLVELHIYLVPKEKWLEKRKLARNQAVDHTISVGFVRVLPQTYLSDLRKEMDQQLGIESVPQNFVFLRSVGRNFTQVRPKQEMEMKVKNYIPPFAPEPELYLKEGHYTGPSTWSQGEDSGLEESLTDSNSQRSHDRATPESLSDDHLVLPKLTDFLDVPPRPDLDEEGPMPPGSMTVSMSAENLTHPTRTGLNRKGETVTPSIVSHYRGPVPRPNYRFSSEDLRYRRAPKEHVQDRSSNVFNRETTHIVEKPTNEEHKLKMRANSWNRRQKRGASKERGGTQLSTWAETRTTRLRRSKALGETNPTANQQKKKAVPPPEKKKAEKTKEDNQKGFDAEDEGEEKDSGQVLMERIRANSRCLRAQMSSRTRKSVSDTGTKNSTKEDYSKIKKNHNGVYTVHTRRNNKSGGEIESNGQSKQTTEIETTTDIKLVDDLGHEVISNLDVDSLRLDSGDSEEKPEIVHHHLLSIEGEDARCNETPTEIGRETEVQGAKTGSTAENVLEPPGLHNSENNNQRTNHPGGLEGDNQTSTDSKDTSFSNDLEEGKLINQHGQLTIEVEVKALGDNAEVASGVPMTTVESNITPITIEDSMEYDSYRVYSDQNLAVPTAPESPRKSLVPPTNTDYRPEPDPVRPIRARQERGVYLKRMELKDASNIRRVRSNENTLEGSPKKVGGSPAKRGQFSRSNSQTRRGKGNLEKWSSTAQSTGDLRQPTAWEYGDDQERLLLVLSEARSETRIRQKQREDLLRRIKQLQTRAHQRREQVREMWRKRYLEAKKVTPRLEEECNRLRQELEKLHRELLAKVQAGVWALLTISGKTERPSNKLSYKIMIARLLQEIEDLTRRVEGTRLKLHTEVKLRAMAEKDVRNLREELLKKKIQVTLTRNQEQAAMGNGLRQQYFISAV